MVDISMLQETLEVVENPGLDTLDPRFQEFSTIVHNENFAEVINQAHEIFAENIYDIRIIGYFLYAVFLEDGLLRLADILECFSKTFQDNWEAVGPTKKKEKQTQKITSWFGNKLTKFLEYAQQKEDHNWQQWNAEISSDDVEIIIENLEVFRKSLSTIIEDAPVFEHIIKINKWLKELQKLVYREPEPEEPGPEEPGPEESEPENHAPVQRQVTTETTTETHPLLEASHHMKTLIRKLEAFEVLTEKEEFAKAALISDDISNIIENFDPKIYFPKIFAKYFSLLAVNIEEISEFWENKDTIAWQTMEQLYQTDLDAFVSL